MGILHNLGQLAGHGLNALPGYSTLGANITNPDINYKGNLNPPTPSNNWLGQGQSTPVGAALTTTDSAGGGVGSSSTSSIDPYAAWGGADKYNALVNGYNAQDQNITSSAHDAAANSATGLHSSILDFLDSLGQGQRKVDNQAVQNELARTQASQGILGMVGRGIRSGGVMLANKNASDSSAAGALANAYGQLGRQQMSNVGNQYALGQNAVDQSQQDLELQRSQGLRHINDSKVSTINSIVTDARTKLADLDAQIAGANLPNRIAIQQQQDQIRQDALGQLQQFDQELASGSAGIQGSSQDARRLQAAGLANAGTAADSQFNFQTQAPAQLQGTGPFASDIPLFSTNKKNQQFA